VNEVDFVKVLAEEIELIARKYEDNVLSFVEKGEVLRSQRALYDFKDFLNARVERVKSKYKIGRKEA